jgi:hypothetical protein
MNLFKAHLNEILTCNNNNNCYIFYIVSYLASYSNIYFYCNNCDINFWLFNKVAGLSIMIQSYLFSFKLSRNKCKRLLKNRIGHLTKSILERTMKTLGKMVVILGLCRGEMNNLRGLK